MKIDHMRVFLRVNGEEIFRFARVEGDGNPTQVLGKQWAAFVSPGITMQGMAMSATRFVSSCVSDWHKRILLACEDVLLLLLLVGLVNQMLSIQDLYSAINYS